MTTQVVAFPGRLLLETVIGPEEIGRRIKRAREKKGWSQFTLATEAHVSPSSVSRWERGFLPPVRELVRIASVLAVSTDEFVEADLSEEDQLDSIRSELAEIREIIGEGRAERHHEHHDLQEQVTAQSALLRELVEAASDLSAEIGRARAAFESQPKRRTNHAQNG